MLKFHLCRLFLFLFRNFETISKTTKDCSYNSHLQSLIYYFQAFGVVLFSLNHSVSFSTV